MKQNAVVDASSYLLTVNQLSKQTQSTAQTKTVVAPKAQNGIYNLPYLPFILTGVLFFGALAIQIVGKIRSAKQLLMAVVIALFAASVPSALTYVQHGTQNQTNASTQTDPKLFHVQYDGPNQALFSWETDIPTLGALRIWKAGSNSNYAKTILEPNNMKQTNHTITASNLIIGTTYSFEILSNTQWFGNGDSPLTFTFIKP